MKKRALWIGGAAALALALSGGLAHAHKNPQERAERIVTRMDQHLNLSPEQEKSAQEIVAAALQQRQEAGNNMRDKVKKAWLQPQLSAEQAVALMEEGKKAREAGKQNMAQALAKMHALLTPQQREEAASMLTHYLPRMSGGYRGHRGHHGKKRWRNRWHNWFDGDDDKHDDDDH